LKDCKRTKKILICTKIGIKNRIKKYSPCEVNIIMGKRTDELQHCDIRITKMETTFWKKLHTPNTWIYSTAKEKEIMVGYTHEKYSTDTINGTGVITLQPGCTARTTEIEIIEDHRTKGEIVNLTLHRENLDIDNLWENTNQTNGSPLKQRWMEIILHDKEDDTASRQTL
jgi:hypothetical protein